MVPRTLLLSVWEARQDTGRPDDCGRERECKAPFPRKIPAVARPERPYGWLFFRPVL